MTTVVGYGVVVVAVVVEWLYYSKRIIIVRWADLSDCFVDFRRKMCIFVSRPMKIVTFLRKKRDPAKRVVDFPLERDTFRNKTMELVEDFDEKSYNNNGKPWKSSGILRVNPIFFIFLSFLIMSLHFFIFSFYSFFFIFFIFHFFIFFHFLSFSFILLVVVGCCWLLFGTRLDDRV